MEEMITLIRTQGEAGGHLGFAAGVSTDPEKATPWRTCKCSRHPELQVDRTVRTPEIQPQAEILVR